MEPSIVTIPDEILIAAREFDEGWPTVKDRIDLTLRHLGRHMARVRALSLQPTPELAAAVERIRQWGLTIKRRLDLPRLRDAYKDARRELIPLPAILQSVTLETLSMPEAEGGVLMANMAINLNPHGCLFILDVWFQECRLWREPRHLLGDDLLDELHPDMVRAIDASIARGDCWERVLTGLQLLPAIIMGT